MKKSNLLHEFIKSIKNYGILKTSSKIINYLPNKLKYRNFKKNIITNGSVEERFTFIYKTNIWGSKESVSGNGSTLLYTENLRK
jgi:hypothetical protein